MKKKKYFLPFIILSILINLNILYSYKGINSIICNFKKETFLSPLKKEIVKGRIYYSSSDNIFTILVNYPVNQNLIFKGKIMNIYYPDKKRAFRIKSKVPFILPFFEAFMGVIEEDFGLGKLGYKFVTGKKKKNLFLTYWELKPEIYKKLKNVMPFKFILGKDKGKLIFVESQDKNGNLISKLSLKKHIKYKIFYFPKEIINIKVFRGRTTKNIIYYSNIKFNSPIPDKIKNLKIPDNIPVKEVEW